MRAGSKSLGAVRVCFAMLNLTALSTWQPPASERLCFGPCCCLPVCFVRTSPGLRQTSTCVCTVLGMRSVPGVD